MAPRKDPFVNEYGVGWTAPGYDAAAVTPNDSADLDKPARAIYIGGAGDVKIDTEAGTTVTFVGLTAGSMLPVRAVRIHATDTTATNLVAIF